MKMGLPWKKEKGEREYLPKLSEEERKFLERVVETFAKSGGSVEAALEKLCESEGVLLEPGQREYLLRVAEWECVGASALSPLLEDEEIEEIAVIGLDLPVFVYVVGEGWKTTDIRFIDGEGLVRLVNRLVSGIGRRLTLTSPLLDAVLPDGSRIHASIPPISSYEITIRKFQRKRLAPRDLVKKGTLTQEVLALLKLAFSKDLSILITGNTGSGKTTLLTAFLSEIPKKERVVIVEETPEIRLSHPHVVRLITAPGFPMEKLIEATLRMRPDRLVIGEARKKEELKVMVEAMLSGQARAVYSTVHSKSSEHLARRLLRAGVDPEDLEAIDLVVVLRRRKHGKGERRILEEIASFSRFGSAGVLRLPLGDPQRCLEFLSDLTGEPVETLRREVGRTRIR